MMLGSALSSEQAHGLTIPHDLVLCLIGLQEIGPILVDFTVPLLDPPLQGSGTRTGAQFDSRKCADASMFVGFAKVRNSGLVPRNHGGIMGKFAFAPAVIPRN
jgi:hypothetical protein